VRKHVPLLLLPTSPKEERGEAYDGDGSHDTNNNARYCATGQELEEGVSLEGPGGVSGGCHLHQRNEQEKAEGVEARQRLRGAQRRVGLIEHAAANVIDGIMSQAVAYAISPCSCVHSSLYKC